MLVGRGDLTSEEEDTCHIYVYVRYVFKNDTDGGQDVSPVRWILAVSSCLWLECQFVFLRGPYVTQCAEMTMGYIFRG